MQKKREKVRREEKREEERREEKREEKRGEAKRGSWPNNFKKQGREADRGQNTVSISHCSVLL